jgi:hypothetical protein
LVNTVNYYKSSPAVAGVVTEGMVVDPPECCGCLATIGHGDLADLCKIKKKCKNSRMLSCIKNLGGKKEPLFTTCALRLITPIILTTFNLGWHCIIMMYPDTGTTINLSAS